MADTTLWIHYSRPRTHWYELSDQERHQLVDTWRTAAAESQRQGAYLIGRYRCRGQSDFEHVEVWQFPSPAAVVEHWDRMRQAAYSDYVVSQNVIGNPERAHETTSPN